MRLAQTRYDLGLATIVELTQAQLSRTSADFASAAARYEYMLKRFTVDYQSGLIH
jgi:outer membrane protein